MTLANFPNVATYDAYNKCLRHLISHDSILVSLSGGADSDVMLDFIIHVCENEQIPLTKLKFAFFDTGIEYQATKDHLGYLESKYNITIDRCRATVPVALGCKKYGLPFLNKDISAKIYSLQHNNFDFVGDGWKGYEELALKYPRCTSVLKWWCNTKKVFNIQDTPYLKEFLIENPPTFRISDRCCWGAKKHPSKQYEREQHIDLKCLGLRKYEGGLRATSIHSCFTDNTSYGVKSPKAYDDYRPIYWFTDGDKREYETFYNVEHSKCYTVYGFKRTGCAGCPFNSKFDDDLLKIKTYEPKLYKAVNNIFGDSYEYTRAYRRFKQMKENE